MPSPAMKNSNQGGASKMQTACHDLMEASYQCLEKEHGDGSKCSAQFDAYKLCKKEERTRIIEARRKGFW